MDGNQLLWNGMAKYIRLVDVMAVSEDSQLELTLFCFILCLSVGGRKV